MSSSSSSPSESLAPSSRRSNSRPAKQGVAVSCSSSANASWNVASRAPDTSLTLASRRYLAKSMSTPERRSRHRMAPHPNGMSPLSNTVSADTGLRCGSVAAHEVTMPSTSKAFSKRKAAIASSLSSLFAFAAGCALDCPCDLRFLPLPLPPYVLLLGVPPEVLQHILRRLPGASHAHAHAPAPASSATPAWLALLELVLLLLGSLEELHPAQFPIAREFAHQESDAPQLQRHSAAQPIALKESLRQRPDAGPELRGQVLGGLEAVAKSAAELENRPRAPVRVGRLQGLRNSAHHSRQAVHQVEFAEPGVQQLLRVVLGGSGVSDHLREKRAQLVFVLSDTIPHFLAFARGRLCALQWPFRVVLARRGLQLHHVIVPIVDQHHIGRRGHLAHLCCAQRERGFGAKHSADKSRESEYRLLEK
eukprot:scaffold7092_cov262-Pinguiococcus_pyrenoidosus.AAC.36